MSEESNLALKFAPAIERLGGDFGLLKEMAIITAADLPGVIAAAEQAIDQQDCVAAGKSLHKLKGMLSTFEDDGVVLELQTVMQFAKNENHDAVENEFIRIRDKVEMLAGQVQQLAELEQPA